MAKIGLDATINSVRHKDQAATPTTTGAGYSHVFTKADGVYVVDENDVVTGPFGKGSTDGWIAAEETWEYFSTDDPSFTFLISGDLTDKYSVGMRIKLTQATEKFFIITDVELTTNTYITVYGGTDYALINAAITDPFYSTAKAPFGFPLDPGKWTEEVKSSSQDAQSTPTQSVWYNAGSNSIVVPIGCWILEYYALLRVQTGTTQTANCMSTLSTADNSESDADYTGWVYQSSGGNDQTAIALVTRKKIIKTTVKVTHYLNIASTSSSQLVIEFRGDLGTTIIRAICAYL